MKEVKSPKKPLFYYYGIVLLIIIVFNVLVTPMLTKTMVKEVDYGTFMSKIEDKKIDDVQIEDNQILFTDKDDVKTIYKTGVMDDPTLTERLYKAGAKFSKEIDQQMSPAASFLLTGVLPLVIFIALGQYMSRKMMNQMGGKNSMAFGMEKAMPKFMCLPRRASVSVMWQVKKKQKKTCRRSLTICIIRRSIQKSVLQCRREFCL